MVAAGGAYVHFFFAEGAHRRVLDGLLAAAAGQVHGAVFHLVERLHDEEYAQRDYQEVDDRPEECAEVDVLVAADRDAQARNIGAVAAGDQVDQRRDDVIDQRGDDSRECRADDDANRHVHDVAAVDELLEFAYEALHGPSSLRSICYRQFYRKGSAQLL